MDILVDKIKRPRLEIEEVKQPDGSLKPGKHFWGAVWFTTTHDMNTVYGKHFSVKLRYGDETWEFSKANIMLAPIHSKDESRYIMTFDNCRMMYPDE